MNIFVIVVTYNGIRWYNKCFDSLYRSSIPVQVIVVDNASSDNTVDYLREKYPLIHLIPSTINLGFAKANNIGIKYALEQKADYIFLLNQDAWVESNTIESLLNTFVDNPNVGIASPIHLNGSYSGLDSGFNEHVGKIFSSDLFMQQLKRYYEVPFVNAAAWLISAECIKKVGGFDTNLYKHYGEDDNYCQRVYFHGLKIILNTQSTICHDREQRKINPLESHFNLNDSFLYVKDIKGNILLEYDIEKEIKSKKIAIIRSIFGLHLKKIKRLRKEIKFEKQVAYSRQQNEKGGLVWL